MAYHRRKPPQVAARDALDHHAEAHGPVPRPHRQSVHGAQHPNHLVPGEVEHGGRDDALGLGVAVQLREPGRCCEYLRGVATRGC